MKKWISMLLALMIVASVMSFVVSAEAAKAEVFVTFSDNTGKLVLTQEAITVQDKNGDGKFDIDEAMFAMHEAKYEGGAAAGYATADGTYGLYITKLWGDTSGNFGYYVNNNMAMGLTDEIKDGDYLDAFVYQIYQFDPVTYATTADTYCFFDKRTASVTEGDSVTVTLNTIEYDPVTYAPSNVAFADAVITIDGTETTYKTDAQGKVTIPIEKEGEFLVSAKKDGTILVPPVLKVTATAKPAGQPAPNSQEQTTQKTEAKPKSDKTSDASGAWFGLLALFGLTAAFAGKKLYEA